MKKPVVIDWGDVKIFMGVRPTGLPDILRPPNGVPPAFFVKGASGAEVKKVAWPPADGDC